MNLPDQPARDQFVLETGRNFSVIAPAGVGKTTAISLRVAQMARDDHRAVQARRAPRLPRLVVVTYTRKAADELRNRAREQIVQADLPPAVFGLFNEAYFGTIHSFCIELVRRFGPLAGLPARFAIEPDNQALHLAFQRDTTDAAAFLPESTRTAWRRYGSEQVIWPLVWTWPGGANPLPPGPCPELNFDEIFSYQRAKKNTGAEENIRLARAQLEQWRAADKTARALGVPEANGGGEEFVTLWNTAFQPLREWLAQAAAFAAAGLAEEFLKFKERRGLLGYDDLARTALQLLHDPVVAARIRAQEYAVILDEAQDTDPAQFAVLLGVAQPAGAPGLWMEGAGAPPAPGRFSMVGDPQQSIYTRSNVNLYLDLHARLNQAGAAAPLVFSVTRRCDVAVVEHVNERFDEILAKAKGQVGFVKLHARPSAGRGGVWRLPVPRPANLPEKADVEMLRRVEAEVLARWLAKVSRAGVGAASWEQVAVLAPRRAWLETVALALQGVGIDAQLHTGDRARGADPARTWLAALLGVVADPADDFEKIGVLREIFGVADDELYRWRSEQVLSEKLAAALALLEALARKLNHQPLRDAVVQAVQATRLRERLAALPEPPAPGALEALLNQAVLADARGETLAAFARSLRRGPAEAAEVAARPGAVQLLTNHKAKGLEWQAVIQFGLFLDPKFAHADYPCWRPATMGDQPLRAFYDSLHADGGDKLHSRLLGATRRAEFERLLYVAATRPKHTLILLDAAALTDKPSKNSLAALLGVVDDGAARTAWQKLPEADGKPARNKTEAKAEGAASPPNIFWPQPDFSRKIFTAAPALAEKFVRRVRPSTLARHDLPPERTEPDLTAPPDYPEEQPIPSAAVAYGNWWHGLMEHTPWAQGREAWAQYWTRRLADAPEPVRARAQKETAQLLNSPLVAQLTEPGLEFAVEMPFLWPEPGGARAFDGCVDLAVWDAKKTRWLVVD
jgi:ATP-dependent exoDNAse (exonuclease V) beta subunit